MTHDTLDECIIDPRPDLVDAAVALLSATGLINPIERGYSSLYSVDRRRLMWLHRALQAHLGQPLTDYSEYVSRR